jgi:hypothetical protein
MSMINSKWYRLIASSCGTGWIISCVSVNSRESSAGHEPDAGAHRLASELDGAVG